jgi:hypothetical protein
MVFRLLHDGLLALEKATYLCLGLHVVPWVVEQPNEHVEPNSPALCKFFPEFVS